MFEHRIFRVSIEWDRASKWWLSNCNCSSKSRIHFLVLFSSVYIPIACVCVSVFGWYLMLCKLLTWIFNVPLSIRGLTCIWIQFIWFHLKRWRSFPNFCFQNLGSCCYRHSGCSRVTWHLDKLQRIISNSDAFAHVCSLILPDLLISF